MFSSRMALLTLSALALASPRLAYATPSVVDFEDNSGLEYLTGGTLSDGGLDFASGNDIGFWDGSSKADDFSEILITDSPVTFTKTGGGAFSLYGLDAGLGDGTAEDSFEVTYAASNGATGSFTIGDTFNTYAFGDLAGITSVTFSGPTDGFMNFDNISVGVPEPMSMSLLAAGLIGLAAARRRREG